MVDVVEGRKRTTSQRETRRRSTEAQQQQAPPPPTVIFHKIERTEAEPLPRWDASRSGASLSGARSMPAIKQSRLSEVVLEDTRREIQHEAARAAGGWEVGQRPSTQMAYLEFPQYERVDATAKDAYGYESAKPGRQPRYIERRNRRDVASRLGWGSANTDTYRPLGEVDPHVSPLRFIAARHETRLRVVLPEAEVVESGDARLQPLAAGRRVSARVRKHSYAFYSIDVQPGLVLRVRVQTLRGDPDLYVCNKHRFPTHEDHTWRATGVGDDLIKIDPDHPDAAPGTYFVSVFGLQETDFVLEAALVPKEVKLPRRQADFHAGGMAQIQREVARGARQRRTLRSGGSLLGAMGATLQAQGVAPGELAAAAAPVAEALRDAAAAGDAEAEAAAGERPPGSAAQLACRGRAVRASLGALLEARLEPAEERRERGELRPRRRDGAAPLELKWRPPEGLTWADMPRETRLHLASSEYVASKRGLHAQLDRQLAALDERRPARYQLRMHTLHALEAVDPQLIADERAMRAAAQAMHAAFVRDRPAAPSPRDESADGSPRASLARASSSSPRLTAGGAAAASAAGGSPAGRSSAGGGGSPAGGSPPWLEDPFADDESFSQTDGGFSQSVRPKPRGSAGRAEQIDLVAALDEVVPAAPVPPFRPRNTAAAHRSSCQAAAASPSTGAAGARAAAPPPEERPDAGR